MGSTCVLDNTLRTFPNGTWLYANSLFSDPNVCGYFVGIANAGSKNRTVQIVRAGAEALTWISGLLFASLVVFLI